MTDKKRPKGDYEVGYGRPPKQYRFKKGQSGNRKGRPRGSINKADADSVLTIVNREAYREVPVSDGTKTIKLPVVTVAIRNLMKKAATGDPRAAQKALELLQLSEEKGASDKALAARRANESFEAFLNTLTLEDIDEFRINMGKATDIRKFSQEAIRQAQRAERKRKADQDQ
jgi:hypothetical protein